MLIIRALGPLGRTLLGCGVFCTLSPFRFGGPGVVFRVMRKRCMDRGFWQGRHRGAPFLVHLQRPTRKRSRAPGSLSNL